VQQSYLSMGFLLRPPYCDALEFAKNRILFFEVML